MSKVALCLIGGLAALAAASEAQKEGKPVSFDVAFVPRDICEKPENGYLQLLPYVSFTTFDSATSSIKYIKYRRPSTGEGEARLLGRASVGFGGHIDQLTDLPETVTQADEALVLEDGSSVAVYRLSSAEFSQTIQLAARREVLEETGIDKETLDGMNLTTSGILREDESEIDEVGRVHLCMACEFNVSPDKFNEILELIKEKAATDEVRAVEVMTIGAGEMIMDFRLDAAYESISTQLSSEEYNAENWTILTIIASIDRIATTLKSNLTLTDLFQAILLKQQVIARAQAEQAEADSANDEDLVASLDGDNLDD